MKTVLVRFGSRGKIVALVKTVCPPSFFPPRVRWWGATTSQLSTEGPDSAQTILTILSGAKSVVCMCSLGFSSSCGCHWRVAYHVNGPDPLIMDDSFQTHRPPRIKQASTKRSV